MTEKNKIDNSDNVYTAHVFVVLCMTLGVIIWRTFCINAWSALDNTSLAIALHSENLQKSHCLLLSLSCSIFYDIIFEVVFAVKKPFVSTIHGDKFISKCERILLFLVTFVPSISYLLWYHLELMPLLFINMNMSINSIGLMIIMLRLLREEKDQKHKRSLRIFLIYVMGIFFSAAQILHIYHYQSPFSSVVRTFRVFVLHTSTILFFYLYFKYVREFIIKFDLLSENRVAIILYGVIIGVFMISNNVINFIFGSFTYETKNANNLIAMAICQFFYTLPGTSLPRFLSRYELHEAHKLLESNRRGFVRYISHEIRSPLNIVIGGLEELKTLISLVDYENLYNLIPKVNETLFSIDHEVTNAVKMLDQILNYESINAGSFFLVTRFVQLQDIINPELTLSLGIFAQSKGVNFHLVDNTSGAKDLQEYIMSVDTTKIHIVIRNLVMNAVKFTPLMGDVTITISKSIFDEEDYLYVNDTDKNPIIGYVFVHVLDTGTGISKESINEMFQPFFQINVEKNLQSGQGSGLGLWISSIIIKNHSGEMIFESSGTGCGSTFGFKLPLYFKKNSMLQPLETKKVAMASLSFFDWISGKRLDQDLNNINNSGFKKMIKNKDTNKSLINKITQIFKDISKNKNDCYIIPIEDAEAKHDNDVAI
jgi:signal transduction histidine kinase